MRTEIINNPIILYADAIEEAEGILSRIDMHQGTFDYLSQVKEGHMFRLVIRPMSGDEVAGQPYALQHIDLFHLNKGMLHIARYHYQ